MKLNPNVLPLMTALILGLYTPKTQAQTPIDNYIFQQFTTEQGLSHNLVNDIVKDRRGYAWLATPSGLNRFDGYSFKVYRYRTNDTSSIANDNVRCLLETRDGTIWAGTDNGFMRYNPQTDNFRRYAAYDPSADKSNNKKCLANIYKMAEDPFSDDIWLSLECGFARFNQKTEQLIFFDIPSPYTDWRQIKTNIAGKGFLFENDSTTWILSQYGLYDFNPKTGRFKSFVIAEYPESPAGKKDANIMTFILQDPSVSYRLWLGTWGNGLASFDKRTGQFRNYKTHPSIPLNGMNNVFISGRFFDRHTLLFTSDEIWAFSTIDGSFKPYIPHYQGGLLKKASNRIIYSDSDSNLWIFNASLGFSVAYRQQQQFVLRNIPYPLAIRAILRGRDSSMFFGNIYINRGLTTWNHKSNKYEFELFPLLNERESGPSQLLEDRKGNIWFGNNLGFFEYDRKHKRLRERIIKTANGKNSSNYKCQEIALDNDDNIWIKTAADTALHKFNPQTNMDTIVQKNIFGFSQSAFSKEMICLSVQDGVKILSPQGQLIETYNSKTLFRHINLAEHHFISLDNKGRIWLGSHEGLVSFERGNHWEKTIRHWTTENGLPSNTIYSIAGDLRGGAWVVVEGSLVYVDTTGQLSIFNNKKGFFDWTDVKIQIDAQGEAMISTGSKYYYQFHTDQIHPLSINASQIAFNDFRLFGKSVSFEKDINYLTEISLKHEQNSFSVVYGAVNCPEPEVLRYSYRLMGLDTHWIDNGSNRYVAFSNLEPRAYELQVRVSAVIGQWTNDYKSLKINIQPAFWQTLPFKIMAWAAFIGLMNLGLRYYVQLQINTERRKQEAVRWERERIFDEIHDELGAYLARIRYMVSDLVQNVSIIKTPSIFEAVTRLSNTSIDALERMNDIIREISASDDTLHNFTADLRAWVIDFCHDARLKCLCDVQPVENRQVIGMIRHNLFLVVKQALRNTVQHASATLVTVTVQWNGHLEIIIKDNGKGFDPTEVKHESSGLRSMHKRMKKIGGTIQIQSTMGVGTTIRLSVPIRI